MNDPDIYYEMYIESLKEIKRIKAEINQQITPLNEKADEINQKINTEKNLLTDLKKQHELCQEQSLKATSVYEKNILAYMRKKIRCERTGKKQIVQIDQDEKIVELGQMKDSLVKTCEKELKEYDELMATKKHIISTFKKELSSIKEEIERISSPLAEEEKKRDTMRWAYERELNKESETELFDNSNSSSYFSSSDTYSSHDSYTQDRYAREQTEELRKQTEELRKQTQLAKREMEKAEHDARKRLYEENRQKRAQEAAIDTRCRSCAVIGCGMRFNKHNINCAGYKPKR